MIIDKSLIISKPNRVIWKICQKWTFETTCRSVNETRKTTSCSKKCTKTPFIKFTRFKIVRVRRKHENVVYWCLSITWLYLGQVPKFYLHKIWKSCFLKFSRNYKKSVGKFVTGLDLFHWHLTNNFETVRDKWIKFVIDFK